MLVKMNFCLGMTSIFSRYLAFIQSVGPAVCCMNDEKKILLVTIFLCFIKADAVNGWKVAKEFLEIKVEDVNSHLPPTSIDIGYILWKKQVKIFSCTIVWLWIKRSEASSWWKYTMVNIKTKVPLFFWYFDPFQRIMVTICHIRLLSWWSSGYFIHNQIFFPSIYVYIFKHICFVSYFLLMAWLTWEVGIERWDLV